MFEVYGPIRSILLKSPINQQAQAIQHVTALLNIYCMAYVNFETEEAALAAFELNTKNPMSKIKVAYYEKGSSGQVAFT